MNALFYLLDAYISDTDDVETRLRDLDELQRYADVCGFPIDRDTATRMRDVGLAWIAAINGGGKLVKCSAAARDALENVK